MADLELNSIGNGDGTNYLVRDNSKIPLSGSNAISGSLIPATTDAYDLGGTSYQWNNAYIKSLTINGVACGNILTHNASEFIPRSGGVVLTGSTFARDVNDGELMIIGGSAYNLGAYLALSGKNNSSQPGQVTLACRKSDGAGVIFELKPNGTAIWNGKNLAMQEDVVPRSGGAVMTNAILGRTINTSEFRLDGGTAWDDGASISLCGKSRPSYPGVVYLHPASDSTRDMMLYPDGTWVWTGTACQVVSDQRLKQQIAEIDDKLLDAWEDVNLVQFKYNDAVETKSDNARLHTGYVVQQIDEACKSHGVDVSKYGLYCHEEYAEETREVEHDDGTKTTEVVRPANEHYSLRYTEALIVECAYLRKKNKDLQEQLNALSERLEKLENR